MKKSWSKMKKSWSKIFLAELVVLLIGVCFIVVSTQMSDPQKTTRLSVGCSLIATAISAFVMDKAQDKTLDDVVVLLEKNQKMLGNFHNLLSTNSRIICGLYLEDTVRPVLRQMIDSNRECNIDVLGFRLTNFWTAHKDELLACPRLKLRMIVQCPNAVFFDKMAHTEGYDVATVKADIKGLITCIINIQSKLSSEQHIEIKWLDYPASVTITRINSMLFVRSRLLRQIDFADYSFFERYTDDELPFSTFTKYFDTAWNMANDDFALLD